MRSVIIMTYLHYYFVLIVYVTVLDLNEAYDPPNRPYCPVNQTYKSYGIDCQNCENYMVVRCAALNKTQCFCNSGYIRDKKQNCILPLDCPACSRNETFKSSGYDCQTCQILTIKCALQYEQKCYCKNGYIRAKKNGTCILRDECSPLINPSPCTTNETLKSSGYDCQTCRTDVLVNCRLQNQTRCYCKDGYVRDNFGRCILKKDCAPSLIIIEPPMCSINQTYKAMGYNCETCKSNKNVYCKIEHEAKCYCKPEYVRDRNEDCILKRDCPISKEKCTKRNTEYSKSKNLCGKRCSDYFKPNFKCTLTKYNGCFCSPGYVLDTTINSCISPAKCPRRRHYKEGPI